MLTLNHRIVAAAGATDSPGEEFFCDPVSLLKLPNDSEEYTVVEGQHRILRLETKINENQTREIINFTDLASGLYFLFSAEYTFGTAPELRLSSRRAERFFAFGFVSDTRGIAIVLEYLQSANSQAELDSAVPVLKSVTPIAGNCYRNKKERRR
jgi:hypothetical protein